MRRLTYFIIAFCVWVLISWPFVAGRIDLQVVVAGLIASAIASLLFHELLPAGHHMLFSPVRIFWLLVFLVVFFYYVVKPNLDVVYGALHPAMPIRPGIVKIKTNLKTNAAITALANCITLTPGTMTVDITPDGYLYIHWINVRSAELTSATEMIAGKFERYIKRILE
ncbi:MAG: Na+/H+ antiporter subunit E [Sedimentisphaerales bacterium]|jgi:multicomponent Na+:H+ antiporter subunit E|nr:Na+/H+ antiporter subunit E [Sedimentisphaerales bacterium]